MATATILYKGELRTEAIHLLSNTSITTDAPPDNHGKGEAFSPTDLLATSLGTCIITTMAIVGGKASIELKGTSLEVTKIMGSNPRRVVEVIVKINFPIGLGLTDEQKQLMEKTAHECPVARSLHPDLKQTVIFNYQS